MGSVISSITEPIFGSEQGPTAMYPPTKRGPDLPKADVIRDKASEIQEQGLNAATAYYQYFKPTEQVARERLAPELEGLKAEASQRERDIQGRVEDIGRRVSQILAQRGTGRTSLGMAALVGGQREASENIGNIRAALAQKGRAIEASVKPLTEEIEKERARFGTEIHKPIITKFSCRFSG